MSSRPSRGAARLAAILDALPDALLLVNANGTVVNANSIALEVMESPGTGLVGRGVLDLLPEFDSKLIPGSMRRPGEDEGGRAKPKRMIARRTDGSEFPVEVTAAHLDGRDAYREPQPGYTGDELLMLVVRDLSETVDTEAELARSQRQTEMILRAAAEGVVGTDTDGRVVLVNPAAAQILGYRATDLGNRELHGLIAHSRADGSPFPFEESPLADTLRSGRKHRVRSQVLWNKSGQPVAVDLTTSPVRDGELLVGAVMTFTDRRPYDALAARHAQLLAVLGESLRGPLDELRGELATLAADDAGQLWPEANQLLHHLAAGYSRMTALVDNVLGFQRLDAGTDKLAKKKVLINRVVAAGVDGAVELIGPGRAQFAIHAPTIEAEVDAERISTALAHLVADVAGVDATGKTPQGSGYMDSTIVVAAAQRGDVVRIEVRGPYEGGSPVHEPIVRGIVAAHGGVLQTVEVPGAPGGAYVLELPLGAGAGAVTLPEPAEEPESDEDSGSGAKAVPAGGDAAAAGPAGRRARRGVDAFLEDEAAAAEAAGANGLAGGPGGAGAPGFAGAPGAPGVAGANGRAGARGAAGAPGLAGAPGVAGAPGFVGTPGAAGPGTGGVPGGVGAPGAPGAGGAPVKGSGGREGGGALALPSGRRRGGEVGAPDAGPELAQSPVNPAGLGTGRRRGRDGDGSGEGGQGGPGRPVPPQGTAMPALPPVPVPPIPVTEHPAARRRALGPAGPVPATGLPAPAPARPIAPEGGFALPAGPTPAAAPTPSAPQAPPAPAPAMAGSAPSPVTADSEAEAPGGRRARRTLGAPAAQPEAPDAQAAEASQNGGQVPPTGRRRALPATPAWPVPAARTSEDDEAAGPVSVPGARRPQDTPVESGQPISVRALGTLGQGISVDASGSGRRRRLSEPAPEGRAFAIGAPEAGSAEGPEPLDGPGGAVEVVNRPVPLPVDDELPPEPLDNPRRLLVWPAPDVQTQQALSDRGYRPVIVHSREEVDAQIAAFPAALFVDPLTGPITRTALQSLRQAAVAAEVPVLVTAGLGHATREAAYGADPAVLLKALAPRDSEQHPSRVLLIEEHDEIATALTAALERRGLQVARAGADTDAVELATRMRPNLVVMDLMQVRRRRAGIVDWLRANGQLNRTPLVVYTTAGIDTAELPRLASGESVLFLAERATTADVQGRIVDLLAKIGTN
ncbi:PAS domain-containing protein [Streptomyces sp. APSN-46.1]|uniref:response regulator n=1 Tax=Streptomyces sp. APSN-46.1 TaxID=2929049 RepID=UPI001FB438BB|nr:PAS domain-containing protein [Streptomyces sp. APSN-46.1]MCJ1678775.1 PAS domain-containing protein [Streptomyces sp. APSN-46.1]